MVRPSVLRLWTLGQTRQREGLRFFVADSGQSVRGAGSQPPSAGLDGLGLVLVGQALDDGVVASSDPRRRPYPHHVGGTPPPVQVRDHVGGREDHCGELHRHCGKVGRRPPHQLLEVGVALGGALAQVVQALLQFGCGGVLCEEFGAALLHFHQTVSLSSGSRLGGGPRWPRPAVLWHAGRPASAAPARPPRPPVPFCGTPPPRRQPPRALTSAPRPATEG